MLSDLPLAHLDAVITNISLRVAKEMFDAEATVETFFFEANGSPCLDGYAYAEDDEDYQPGVTPFCRALRDWYLAADERIHDGDYTKKEKKQYVAAVFAKFQDVRDAIRAAWTKAQPEFPCHWNETNCLFVVAANERNIFL